MRFTTALGVALVVSMLVACGQEHPPVAAVVPVVPSIYVSDAAGVSAWNVATGQQRWQQPLSTVASAPRLLRDGDTLYRVATELTALRVSDGQVLWHLDLAGATVVSPLVLVARVLYLDTGQVTYTVTAQTGQVRWRYQHTLAPPALVVLGKRVYVLGGGVMALDAATGALVWQVQPGNAYAVQAPLTLYSAAGLLYVATQEDALLALDPATGQQRWGYQSPEGLSTPTFGNGMVYVATLVVPVVTQAVGPVYTIVALNASTGAVAWQQPFPLGQVAVAAITPPVLAHNQLDVFAGATEGDVVALAPTTGQILWRVSATDQGQLLVPIATGDIVAVAVSGTVTEFTMQGGQHWQFAGIAGSVALVVADDVAVLVLTTDGTLLALAPDSGTIRWQAHLGATLAGGTPVLVR